MVTRPHGTLRLTKAGFVIEASPHVTMRLRRWFPRVVLKAGAIIIKHTPEVARDLEWFLDRFPLEVSKDAAKAIHDMSADYKERDLFARGILNGDLAPRVFSLTKPARDYQARAAELALKTGGLLLADELGLGKTLCAICIALEPKARPFLFVTLTALPRQMQSKFAEFAPELRTKILLGTTPYNLMAGKPPRGSVPGQALLYTEPMPDVIITSYSKLAGWGAYLSEVVRGVCWDEAQELRHEDSERYVAASLIASSASYRIGLTGTPIYNYGDELHSVMECIAPGALGTREEYLREWCNAVDNRGRAVVKDPKALGSHLRDSGLMLRRTRVEVKREIPAVTRIVHEIDTDTDALDNVKDRARELAKIILQKSGLRRGDAFEASQEFSMLLRQATGIAKAPLVSGFLRMLLEGEEKIVVGAWHRACYDIWLKDLEEFKPVMYTGSETPNQKEAAFKSFVEGDARLMFMSLRSGAGLDGLQAACSTCVHAELDWSPAVHDQFEGRIARDGQERPVMSYFPMATSGSDPVVADVLALKKAQLVGIRDPFAEVFATAENTDDRIKRLASAYLEKLGG